MMKLRLARPAHVVDLGGVQGLAYITDRDGALAIGSMTTYYMLESSSLVQKRAQALSDAASLVADLQVRNKGSIGGSLAHADPASDLPAVALALEARIKTIGGGRARNLPADRFFLDVFTTSLRDSEIITEIEVPPLPPNTASAYLKFANQASHFAVIGVAAVVTLDKQGACARVRIGVTGAGPRAVRARATERYLTGKEPTDRNLEQAARRSTSGIDYLSDLHASAEYREHLTGVFTRRALSQAVARASG
jgi:carbon-monoxide dehydrogenase medium subunit